VLESLSRGFERVLAAIVGLLLVALTLIVVVAVIYRKAGHSLVWYDEVASIMLVWLTYYGAALAALKRAHIGFDGFVNSLQPRLRLAAVLFGEVCVIGFFGLLAWVGWRVVQVLEGVSLVSLPWVPVRLTQSIIPIGAVLFIAAQLLSLPDVLRRARQAAPAPGGHGAERAAEEEHAPL
jgi:TRAP-type C4-dicarboxylate transport system permease small subunit